MTKPALKSNAESVERTCYMLCETGRFGDAMNYLNQAMGKFLNAEESAGIRQSLTDDYLGFRELL